MPTSNLNHPTLFLKGKSGSTVPRMLSQCNYKINSASERKSYNLEAEMKGKASVCCWDTIVFHEHIDDTGFPFFSLSS
jgi:hypothetical protein